MSESRKTIGFDRQVDRQWLDATAGCVIGDADPSVARACVWSLLEGEVEGTKLNSARGKTATVLNRIWVVPPSRLGSLRDDALACFADTDDNGRLALHWAMMLAAYPFFADLAETVGKLARLNGDVAISQAIRRTTPAWGDRTTIPRAVQRVVRSMAKWGVLQEVTASRAFRLAPPETITDPAIAEILIRAIVLKTGHGMRFDEIKRHAGVFPFSLERADPTGWVRLGMSRQGDRSDFVDLA